MKENNQNPVAETAEKEVKNVRTGRATTQHQPFSEFFKKRKNRMNPKLVKEIEETAKREILVEDEYGTYKPGIFTHRSCIVTVKRDENKLWSILIWSENHISDFIVEEVCDRFVPDETVMARLYGSRKSRSEQKGVMLYELPIVKEE